MSRWRNFSGAGKGKGLRVPGSLRAGRTVFIHPPSQLEVTVSRISGEWVKIYPYLGVFGEKIPHMAVKFINFPLLPAWIAAVHNSSPEDR